MKAVRYRGGTTPLEALYEADINIPEPTEQQVLTIGYESEIFSIIEDF